MNKSKKTPVKETTTAKVEATQPLKKKTTKEPKVAQEPKKT